MLDYITKGDTIIFDPNFNKSIDINLLNSYNKVIFSNFELCDDLFEKYSESYCGISDKLTLENHDKLNFIGSKFNQPLELPPNVTHLILGLRYNLELNLPLNLTHLILGTKFNKYLELPSNLSHLTIGMNYEKYLLLPHNLTHLTLYCKFLLNTNLDSNITHLTLGSFFDQTINIPKSVKYLKFEFLNFKIFGDEYKNHGHEKLKNLDKLHEGLEVLIFGRYLSTSLNNLPLSLKVIKLCNDFVGSIKYNKKINAEIQRYW